MKKILLGVLFIGLVIFNKKIESFASSAPDLPQAVFQRIENSNINNYSCLAVSSFTTDNGSLYFQYTWFEMPAPCYIYCYKYTQNGMNEPLYSYICVTDETRYPSNVQSTLRLDGQYSIENVVNISAFMRYVLHVSDMNGGSSYYHSDNNSFSGGSVGVLDLPTGTTKQLPLYIRANNQWSTVPVFESAEALYNYLNGIGPIYDSNLTISSPRLSGLFGSNAYNVLFVSCKGSDNIDKVVLTAVCDGVTKTVDLDEPLNLNYFINSVGLDVLFPDADTGDDVYFYLTGYDSNGNYSNTLYTKGKIGLYFERTWTQKLNNNDNQDIDVNRQSNVFFDGVLNPNEYNYSVNNPSQIVYTQNFYTESNDYEFIENYIINNIYNFSGDTIYNTYYNLDNNFYNPPEGYYTSPFLYIDDLGDSKGYVYEARKMTLTFSDYAGILDVLKPLLSAFIIGIGVVITTFIVALVIKFIDIIWP